MRYLLLTTALASAATTIVTAQPANDTQTSTTSTAAAEQTKKSFWKKLTKAQRIALAIGIPAAVALIAGGAYMVKKTSSPEYRLEKKKKRISEALACEKVKDARFHAWRTLESSTTTDDEQKTALKAEVEVVIDTLLTMFNDLNETDLFNELNEYFVTNHESKRGYPIELKEAALLRVLRMKSKAFSAALLYKNQKETQDVQNMQDLKKNTLEEVMRLVEEAEKELKREAEAERERRKLEAEAEE